MDFSDENYSMPMLMLFKMTGPIKPECMRRIVNERISEFFGGWMGRGHEMGEGTREVNSTLR